MEKRIFYFASMVILCLTLQSCSENKKTESTPSTNKESTISEVDRDYNWGIEYYNEGKWSLAKAYFQKVDSKSKNYFDAIDKISKCTEKMNNGDRRVDFTISAEKFFNEYNNNELGFEEKYSGKTIKVTGPVYKIESNGEKGYLLKIVPEDHFSGIECFFPNEEIFKSKLLKYKKGNQITVTGVFKDIYIGCIRLKDCTLN